MSFTKFSADFFFGVAIIKVTFFYENTPLVSFIKCLLFADDLQYYAPIEEELIRGNHLFVPKPLNPRYHIFNWKNIYFSVFYCFELANISHRSLLRSKVDLLFAIEYNKDTNYFSNLVESIIRDVHCFVVQVNSSHFGDTRISQPTSSYNVDIVKIKGGQNDVSILGTIEIDRLREFQRLKYSLSKNDKSFKPLPPDFDENEVIGRIKNL